MRPLSSSGKQENGCQFSKRSLWAARGQARTRQGREVQKPPALRSTHRAPSSRLRTSPVTHFVLTGTLQSRHSYSPTSQVRTPGLTETGSFAQGHPGRKSQVRDENQLVCISASLREGELILQASLSNAYNRVQLCVQYQDMGTWEPGALPGAGGDTSMWKGRVGSSPSCLRSWRVPRGEDLRAVSRGRGGV